MPETQSGIFISYRRDSTAAVAGRLYDRLTGALGKECVFIDIDMIEPGEDFVDVLDRKLERAVAVVVLIGRDWVTCKDSSGNARLSNPDDFVRLEVAAALNGKVRVIPVLVDGAHMPSSQDLPSELAPLSRRQAIDIDHARFNPDVAKLIDICRKLLDQQKAETERIAEARRAEEVQAEVKRIDEERKLADQQRAEQAEAARIAREEKAAADRQRAEAERLTREKAAIDLQVKVFPVAGKPDGAPTLLGIKRRTLIASACIAGGAVLIGEWFRHARAEAALNQERVDFSPASPAPSKPAGDISGTWESTDNQKRFRITVAGTAVSWMERNASGAELTRSLALVPGDRPGTVRINRSNDEDAVAFMFRPQMVKDIMARNPAPSYLVLSGGLDSTLNGEWHGLFATQNFRGGLDALIPPADVAVKPYVFRKAP